MIKPVIIIPENNTLLMRNHFIIDIDDTAVPMIHNSTQYQISRDPFNFEETNLVFNYIETNKNILFRTNIAPSFIAEDRTYGIRVRFNEDDWSDVITINVKPESGWETLLIYPTTNLKKDHVGFVKSDFGEDLFIINETPFKYNIASKQQVSLAKPMFDISSSKYIACGIFIYEINTANNALNLSRYNNNFNIWEYMLTTDQFNFESFGCYTKDNNIVIIGKDRLRSNPSELTILKVFNDTTNIQMFKFVNSNYDQDIYDVESIIYYDNLSDYDVISLNCKIPKSLDVNDTNLSTCIIKFKVKENTLDIYQVEVPELIEVPHDYINPIYSPSSNRIYWNNKDPKEESAISWDGNTFKKNKVIPYGGTLYIRNQFDNRIYSLGCRSRKDGHSYLKRYIE